MKDSKARPWKIDRDLEFYSPNDIESLPGRRGINEATVCRLMESIKSIGLRTPITVRILDDFKCADGEVADGAPVLVTGAHRLEAVKRLGWERIECFQFDSAEAEQSGFGDDETTAKLWEISENLDRAELTPLERSEMVAEWIRLTDQKPSQVGTVSKGGRGKAGGINAAARDLGISKTAAHRATKIAAIPEKAKQAARDAGLDRNQSALEKIAKADKPVQAVKAIAKRKADPEAAYSKARALLPDMDRKGLADLAFRCIDLIARNQDEAALQELCRLNDRALHKLLPIRDALTEEAARKKAAKKKAKAPAADSPEGHGLVPGVEPGTLVDPATGDVKGLNLIIKVKS